MSTARKGEVRAQATEGFLLHCLVAIHMSAIAEEALGASDFSLSKKKLLGFVTLTPGLTVGELVQAVRVSHQSINTPLRQLIDEGFVSAKIGSEDRRQKCLFPTPKGRRFYLSVLGKNLDRVEQVFRAATPAAIRGFLEIHRCLVESSDLQWVERAARVVQADEGRRR